jgi:hypothetical protein
MWFVPKIGSEFFDVLHACGLAVLIATATKEPVQIDDRGAYFQLRSTCEKKPQATSRILAEILKLPTRAALRQYRSQEPAVSLANLDGCLAFLFTTPGVRVNSVNDLKSKLAMTSTAYGDAIAKVKSFQRSLKSLDKNSNRAIWLTDLLRVYEVENLQYPGLIPKPSGQLGLNMILDPGFSYSTHSPYSTGEIEERSNIGIANTPHATLLARLGAARFLRSQRVAGNCVNFYVPQITQILITANSCLPLLTFTSHKSSHAAVAHWVHVWQKQHDLHFRAAGLAYHTLQTQGAQQSISLNRVCLSNRLLARLNHAKQHRLIHRWQMWLGQRREVQQFDMDLLTEALLRHNAKAWLVHLEDIHYSKHCLTKPHTPYELQEIKVLMNTLNDSAKVPLREIINGESGTLRFGHALRLLRNHDSIVGREMIEKLERVQNDEQLLQTLTLSIQECLLAQAKSPFIIIPNDDDLLSLCNDLEKYPARLVAKLLALLSTLQYPPVAKNKRINEVTEHPQTTGESHTTEEGTIQ